MFILSGLIVSKFLKYSKLIVSSSSGTVLEALVCGIPVAIIDNKISGDFYGIPSHISNDQIFSISNPNQLLMLLEIKIIILTIIQIQTI